MAHSTINLQVQKMTDVTKQLQIGELLEFIVDAMDMSALEDYVKSHIADYYSSPEGAEDFATNYAEMKEIIGD